MAYANPFSDLYPAYPDYTQGQPPVAAPLAPFPAAPAAPSAPSAPKPATPGSMATLASPYPVATMSSVEVPAPPVNVPAPPPVPTEPPPVSTAPNTSIGTQESLRAQLAKAYKDYTGRDSAQITDQEFQSWLVPLAGGNWTFKSPDWEAQIKNSPEAQAYAKSRSAATTTGTASGGAYSDASFQHELEALPPTGDSTRKVVAAHPEWGITVLNTKGDKVRLSDGRIMDVGYSFGNPANAKWQFIPAGGGTMGALVDPFANGSYGPLLDPWTEPFTGGGARPALPTIGPFNEPGPFKGPTPEEAFADPGYVFARDQSLEGLQNSAAAKGLLRSGGTLKDLLAWGNNFATQRYGDVYKRRADEYDKNLAALIQDYQLDTGATLTNAQLASNRYDADYDKQWREYLEREDAYRKNQAALFDRLKWRTELGYGAAGA